MPALNRTCIALRCAALAVTISVLALAASGCSRVATKPADSISAPDREVLAQYEAMRAALADDDIRKAHTVGEKLLRAFEAPGVSTRISNATNAAKVLANSYRIDVLRSAFKDVSAVLIPLCQDVEGYYIVTTNLVTDGSWVQTSRVIGNPYLGRSMALYGEIK